MLMILKYLLLACNLGVVFSQDNSTTSSPGVTGNTTEAANTQPQPTVIPCTEHCPKDIRFIRWIYPPYTYSEEEEEDGDGFFEELLINKLLLHCCGPVNQCFNYTYQANKKRHEDLNDAIGSTLLSNETEAGAIYFPVYGTMKKDKYQERQLYPIVESSGVLYIELKGRRDNSATKVLGKLVGGWPVLMLTIIMAAVSGIAMWAMDSYYNPDEFPPTFFKGAWEGFWWAFISMTTVGYGDIAPRSFAGRIFSFFWILIGLTIISIFTATVTSALTELSLTQELKLYGKKMIVWNLTEEHRYGVKENAKVLPIETIGDFTSGIRNLLKTIREQNLDMDGGLIDNYVAGRHELKLSRSEFQVPKVFEYDYSYGFLTDGAMEGQGVSSCLRRKVREFDEDITKMIGEKFKKYENSTAGNDASGGFNLFDTDSPEFKFAAIACSGAIFILMMIGAAWEYIFWTPKKQHKKFASKEENYPRSPYTTYEEMITKHVAELEEAMHDECVNFYKSFHKTIEEVRANRVYVEGEEDEIEEEEELNSSDLSLNVTDSKVALVS